MIVSDILNLFNRVRVSFISISVYTTKIWAKMSLLITFSAAIIHYIYSEIYNLFPLHIFSANS